MDESVKNETEQEKSFENAMGELETIVKRLEENEVPLEEAIDLFQKGVTLSKQCHSKLQKVEDQLDRILGEDGSLRPLNMDKEDGAR